MLLLLPFICYSALLLLEYVLYNETKGSTVYRNPCSNPSAARALLRGLRVSIDSRSCWSKYLEHCLSVPSIIREGLYI